MSWATIGGAHGGPDWVLLGTPNAKGGVYVWASKELTYGELRAEMTSTTFDPFDRYRPYDDAPVHTYILKVNMKTVFVVAGPDYPTALATLMREWQPPGGPAEPKRALGEGQRALPDPRGT